MRSVGRLLNRRVRINGKLSVRVWFVFVCLGALVVTLVQLLKSENSPNTLTTVIDLDMNESSFTTELLQKFPIPRRSIKSEYDQVFHEGCVEVDASTERLNALFVVLSRNKELKGVIKSMKSMERHFNQWYNYPWVFLNDEEHSEEFKTTVLKYTQAKVSFGTIPLDEWNFPNQDKEFHENIVNQGDRGIMYGQMESYHKMCRFYSKYFFKHQLVKNLEWYWRVEPDVEFYCDLTYDPFLEMAKLGKSYGFTVMIKELLVSIPNLFRYTKSFINDYDIKVGTSWKLFIKDLDFYEGKDKHLYRGIENVPDLIHKIEDEVILSRLLNSPQDQIDKKLLNMLINKSNSKGLPKLPENLFQSQEYNLCHFWSNFEIARTDLFNNELYEQYIAHLENSGGFYKERWGDLPIHSLALGLFTNLSDIHYFRDIGYKHSTLGHCPNNSPQNQLPFKPGNEKYNTLYTPDAPVQNGVGCRCKCPKNSIEIENSGSSCMGQWINLLQNPTSGAKLDIDKIRSKIEEMIDLSLQTGATLSEWSLSEDDIKLLTKERV